jgi:hypothetical protein
MTIHPARTAAAALVALAALSPPSSSGAQPANAPAGVTAAPACTYDACALRLERTAILRGAGGAPVGRLGTFGAPALTPLVAGSDSAARHAAVFDREYGTGKKLLHGGAVVALVPLTILLHRTRDLDRDVTAGDWALLAAAVPGLAVEIWGARKVERSLKALSRAVWWYNRDLPR